MSYKIKFTPASKKDYDKLDNSQKLQVRKSLQRSHWNIHTENSGSKT